MFGGGSILANDCAKFDAAGNLVSAGAACGSGSGGAVSAVFGRSGAIAAQAGDYSFAQLSGTLLNAQIAAGIDAVKIGAGSVANTAFGYLANVTSDIQTQLNAKAASTHSHTIAGDVTGNIATASVVRIQSRTLSPAAPLNGQVLTWNAASNNWEPQPPSGASGNNALQIQGRNVSPAAPADGQTLVWTAAASTWQPAAAGSGSGASASGQLTDLQVALTNATTLTVAAGCSAIAPCNVRFGNTVYSIASAATIGLTGSAAGTAYIYVSPNGAITVGHNLNLACLNCTAVSSVISFPSDAIPLWTWTSSSGSWDATGGRDRRAFLTAKPILPGTGIVTTDSGGATTIALDTAVVNTYASGAGVPSGTCSVGQVFFRANNTFYVCASANTWTLLGAGGGSGNVTNTSGAGAPAGVCTAGQSWYLDTTNQDAWFCSATNTWKKVISTTNTGSYLAEGQAGVAPPTPAAGLLREYFDSTAKVPQAVDDAGIKSTMVRVASAPANQFATGFNASGVQQFAQPSFANLSGAATSAQLPAVALRRVCSLVAGANNGATLTDADIGPQGKHCQIPYAATIYEIDVAADAGTPNVMVTKRHCTAAPCAAGANETVSNLTSAALATAASGGTACSAVGAAAGLDTFTTCSATLQNTALLPGDWIEVVSGTAGGVAKRMSIDVHYTVN